MEYPNFIFGSYESQSVTADQERTVNFYVERMESPGATTRAALYPTPGVELVGTATTTAGRAHFAMAGREFMVIGSAFLECNALGILTLRGTVAIGNNPATINSNGDGGGQLFITSGDNGYIFDLGTAAFTQVAALNGKATMGGHLDGYFLALDAATSTWYFSALLDGLTWPTGINFAQRSLAPDPWLSMIVNGRYIWLLGEQTSEAWYNSGKAFPFAAHPSGLIPYGIAAPFARAVADGVLVWLGSSASGNGQVLKAAGFQPEVITSYPVQTAINGYPRIDDALADAFNYLGHTFFRIDFPAENVTWVWDSQTSLWFQIMTWISEDNEYVAWRPRWHALAFGEHRMLDAIAGSVHRVGRDLGFDVDGRPIRRLRRAPAIMDENGRVYYSSFELDLEPGLGLSTGQGSDPQVMYRFSDDGGKTWSSEQMMSAGKIGEYDKRVKAHRCGMGRRRVFEVSFSDPIPWRLTAAYLGVSQAGQRRTA